MRWFLLSVLFAATAHAQEIVKLNTRPGVTQSFFIASMGAVKPQAAALLFIGGGGNIRLRMEEGQPKFGALNFLPRSRGEFIRNGILPVIMDNPGDQQTASGMSDAFRESEAQAPLLFVHHREDACGSTCYQDIPRGVAVFPLVSVKGGKPPESGPCDPLHAHGFYGREPETVDAIAAWMLKKPFRKEID